MSCHTAYRPCRSNPCIVELSYIRKFSKLSCPFPHDASIVSRLLVNKDGIPHSYLGEISVLLSSFRSLFLHSSKLLTMRGFTKLCLLTCACLTAARSAQHVGKNLPGPVLREKRSPTPQDEVEKRASTYLNANTTSEALSQHGSRLTH